MQIEEIEKIELQREEKLPVQKLKRRQDSKKILDIVYLMVWTKTCGGSKIILEYVNRLAKLGHHITIMTYDQKPTWFPLDEKIKFIQLNTEQKMENYIPSCDLVVATSWKNIYSAVKANCAPVAYFEQGGSHIFAKEGLSQKKQEIVEQRIQEASFIYTVSNDTKKVINEKYGREAFVVHNAVDSNIFYPREKQMKQKDTITITTIGPEEFAFKHVDNIIQAVNILKQRHSNIEFKWITQTKPEIHKEENAIVNPSQIVIGDTLRNTDIYVCASEYESFGLPVLEAMTCGAAIITTNNGGVSDFVEDKVNGLMIEKDNIEDIVNKMEFLILNTAERERLAENANKTAKKFSWDISVKRLEEYYREIAKYEVVVK